MKETIKKLLIGTFILGSFSTQANLSCLNLFRPTTQREIQEFNKLKTNLTDEQKEIVILALRALHQYEPYVSPTEYITIPAFKIVDKLINPYTGTIYSVKWEPSGISERFVILFLQEFVNQSEIHFLTKAVNEALLKVGEAAAFHDIDEIKRDILKNPLWFKQT